MEPGLWSPPPGSGLASAGSSTSRTGFGGLNALPAAKKLRAPALFVAGRDDGSYALATRTLYRAAASEDKKLLMAPTSWHGVDLVSRPDVKKAVLAFIARVS